jgi:hypothetical protein
MDLPYIPIQSINAISQRGLFDYWCRVSAGKPFPSIGDFNLDERIHDPNQLAIWRVEEGKIRHFRALYQGAHILDAFGTNWPGKTMDEVIPEFARHFAVASAIECVRSGCAIYSVFRTPDANGHAIDCERLLLPLGRAAVEQIVASVQLVSVRGEFRRDTVLKDFEAQIDVVLSGKIANASRLTDRR